MKAHLLALALLAPSTALAEENQNEPTAAAPHRFGVYGTASAGVASAASSPLVEPVALLGVEGAFLFNGLHGFRAGFAAGRTFGPDIKVLDLDYSVQVSSSRRLDRVSVSAGLLAGPMVAFVDFAPDGSHDATHTSHTSVGVRLGALLDLNLWYFTLGIDGSLRAGTSSAGNETMATAGVHLGFSYEMPLSSRWSPRPHSL